MLRVSDEAIGRTVYNDPRHPTPRRIKREIRRLTSQSMFVENHSPVDFYLGDAIKLNIQPSQISVIDVWRVPTISQPFIIGDVMRNIEQHFQSQELTSLPNLVIFIDELNTFTPRGDITDPVSQQIIEISRKGRARRTALFGAEQFKSEVHRQVWGNCTLHVIGRSGSAELRTPPYGELDEYTKNQILRLGQGEMILSFRIWRYPIKITFPRPPYKRPSKE